MFFKKIKKEYLDKISNDTYYIEEVLNQKNNPIRVKEMIFNPKSVEELALDNELYTIYKNISYLNNINFEKEEINYDSLEFVNCYIEIIKALKENNNNRLDELKYLSPNILGKMYFQGTRLSKADIEVLKSYIANKCGFDIDDESSYAKFNIYFEEANNYFNSLINSNIKDIEAIQNITSFMSGFNNEFTKAINVSKNLQK